MKLQHFLAFGGQKVTIHQLQIFHVVCQELNYSIAAEKCFVSRQALRQSISTLESELGGALFVNKSNHIALTEKGAKLRKESLMLIQEYERLERVMQAENRNKTMIHLAVSESLYPDYLPDLEENLETFQEKFASLQVELQFMPNDDVAAAILTGNSDCGLVLDMQKSVDGVIRGEISSHRAAIICSPQSPLSNKDKIVLEDLRGYSVCLPGIGVEFAPFLYKDYLSVNIVEKYYQMLYYVGEDMSVGVSRYIPKEYKKSDVVRLVPLADLPPLCCGFLIGKNRQSVHLYQLRDYLKQKTADYFQRIS